MVRTSSRRIAEPLVLLFFAGFLLFPYLVLLLKFGSVAAMESDDLWWALKNSCEQAFGSAVGALALGAFFCVGLCSLENFLFRRRLSWIFPTFQFLVILPSFMPPLVVLLTLFAVIDPFPIGMVGVIFAHTVMNAGMVALMLRSVMKTKLLSLMELSFVEGASSWQFLRSSVGWIRRDLFSIFFFVFTLCFCSFSVPLTLGGGRSTTLEILIYEKLRISGDWGQALSLSLLQLLIVFIFSLVPLKATRKIFGRGEMLPMFQGWFSMTAVVFAAFGGIGAFCWYSLDGWSHVFEVRGLWPQVLETIPASLALGFGVGFCLIFLLLFSSFVGHQPLLRKMMMGIVSPSTSLVGFSLLFMFENDGVWGQAKWTLGFSYLILTTLYRWGWDQELTGLQDQVVVAETLGASRWRIFRDILLPQLIRPGALMAGVGCVWAMGDFSLGKILLSQDVTLAMLVETLMSSYRIEAAMALMGLVLLMGFFGFLAFWGMGYVARRILVAKI
ncbi:MAG: hypothetical protein COT73_00080 [Bdellovibrio sp. CG10_big_fil_rev_8_21_14_0_10_47_8]|nr:MAG: hypothetical protein COT73_00080 [Bdellovibrio sp. CG10_big_fil_rev_8_21_14_0_10_47_8]